MAERKHTSITVKPDTLTKVKKARLELAEEGELPTLDETVDHACDRLLEGAA